MKSQIYNITASFKIPEDLKYTIQYYISHHILNKLKIVNNYYTLNDGLNVGTMIWENIKEEYVAELEGCLKEIAELFMLKEIKIATNIVEQNKQQTKEDK